MISIIIPVYNESGGITELLSHLDHISNSKYVKEVIVVDGGSIDNTLELLHDHKSGSDIDFKVLRSEKGRARQMNKGARKAISPVLYFLHADSFPPSGFDRLIITSVRNGNPAGCFRMKFDARHPLLQLSQWFTRFNFKACRGGDQSLFVSREVFESLEGFNESFEIYEDCEFINRLYDQYSFTVLKDYVITSARKYRDNGTFRLQYHFLMIHLKKWTGASAIELSRYYHKYILT